MEKELIYSYDKERDVLYVSIGEPQDAIADEIVDDIFVNLNPESKKVVGFTIINFEKKFVKNKKEKYPSFRIPIEAEFTLSSLSK